MSKTTEIAADNRAVAIAFRGVAAEKQALAEALAAWRATVGGRKSRQQAMARRHASEVTAYEISARRNACQRMFRDRMNARNAAKFAMENDIG